MNFGSLLSIMRKRPSRYLLAGLWNTAFSYVLVILLYEWLHVYLHTMIIGAVATVINVAQSFLVHKIFVFKTKGHWFQEIGKSYVVYGFVSAFGILLLWLLVDIVGLMIYLSQAVIMLTLAVISYIGHLKFTFRH